jgi:S-adenosylmethionine decarboxylase
MQYNPGLHILSEFTSDNHQLLSSGLPFRQYLDNLIIDQKLNKVGEVYHDFEGGGFTAVVCLTESHISIHTWPEFKLATFDVFLSNYQNENDEKARALYQGILAFYNGTEKQKNEIKR